MIKKEIFSQALQKKKSFSQIINEVKEEIAQNQVGS